MDVVIECHRVVWMHNRWIAYVALAVLVLAVYAQTVRHDFLNFDDPLVVTDNPHVQAGLTWESIRWAWTTGHFANWMPLTWMSHQLDWQLFGSRPGGHHLQSVLFHLAGVLLLFDALRRMTAHAGASFVVAGLYAVHPLHAESVAWVSERKGVLSTFFWMLAMWLYARMSSAHPSDDLQPEQEWHARFRAISAVTLAMVAGLLCKQMLVTLPVALLLLDVWPLGRWDGSKRCLGRLLAEKVPLFAAAAAFAVVAYVFQSGGNAVANLEELPLRYRLANAAYSAVAYLRRVVWPSDLSPFYPHPLDSLPVGAVTGSIAVLVMLTTTAVLVYRRYPFATVGWFWYLATLLPVSGLIPVGRHGMADRYSDIPLIGVYIALVWGWRSAAETFSIARSARVAAATAVLLSVALAGFLQTARWRTSQTLFEYVLRIDPDNYMALNQLGALALGRGDDSVAMRYFDASIAADPSFPIARANRAWILKQKGLTEEYKSEIAAAAELGDARAAFEAARIQFTQGRVGPAIDLCRHGLSMLPDDPDGLGLLGYFLMADRRTAEAEKVLERAIEVAPDFADAHRHLAVLRLEKGQVDSAREHFLLACSLNEKLVDPIKAAATQSRNPVLLDISAECLAQAGRRPEAVEQSRLAVQQAADSGQHELARLLIEHQRIYRDGK